MNFYNILGIDQTATKSEIKKAYHNLAIKYHPDKCPDSNSKEKFQEIHTAYEILYDDEKRAEYNKLSKEERMQVFDLIKVYLTEINPKGNNFFNTILDTFYHNKEDELRNDVNTFNIKSIFTKITDELIKYIEPDKENNIYVTLKEKYENKFKYVKIKNETYIVPISNNNFVIWYEDKSITLNIICYPDENFQIIDEYDLLYIKKVSLYQYLYGGKIKIQHVNNENILFEFDCCLEKKPIFAIENKGLIKKDNTRGTLYIYLTIEGVNSIQDDDASIAYSNTVKNTLEMMFPNNLVE
ncbi:DnaJ domain protein [Indivirus ILV1]|uniref:DnaJ domain protein n=1 Tax=Indivirus ILV1 TaxID=1977633 RepID=A0A1V0SCV5_9VIRU|nr:DnaJ domain protein [Indivirus ILV1]